MYGRVGNNVSRSNAHAFFTLAKRDGGEALELALYNGRAPADAYDVNAYRLVPERTPRYARVSVHRGDPMRDVSPAPLMTLDGLAATLMLIDRRSGEGLGFVFFESEEALQRGDAVLADAEPGTAGAATSTELYDVLEFATW